MSSHDVSLRPPRQTRPLAVMAIGFGGVAVVLALLGGLVPGIAHQVALGRLSSVFEPEQYLGAPYAGSISGRTAFAGALCWSTLTVLGLVLHARRVKAGFVLLVAALVLTVLVNVALPLYPLRLHWSILGVLQTVSLAAAMVAARLDRADRGGHSRRGPAKVRAHATPPTEGRS